VVYILDGNTIEVLLEDGKVYRIRYIGVDTPGQGDYYATQATHYNTRLVNGKTVTLVKDESETDASGRLLRYVLVDETFVNYDLVARGFALASETPPDTACASYLAGAQDAARTALAGFWRPTPTATPTQEPRR
jgi:micrococcal nuclease